MKTRKFVVCLENKGYATSLEIRKLYEVLRDENAAQSGFVRIIDESGEDYLYPRAYFIEARLTDDVYKAITQAA